MHQNQKVGDWPFALMLDETWLRVRRTLVHKLEESRLWMQSGPYLDLMRQQQGQGKDLKETLLLPMLGPVDYACLNGEAIFGSANHRFRSRMPQVLSFGYEIGRGMRTLRKNIYAEQDEQIARLCALFNLGISVFDMVYDLYPGLSKQFAEIFNEQTLLAMRSASKTKILQNIVVDELLADELRILLKLIAAFFMGSSALVESNQDGTLHRELFDLLQAAYRAEVQSVQPDEVSNLPEVARAKSILPFAVIHRLISTRTDSCLLPYAGEVDEIMKCMGTLFWRVDDISDVVRDLQSGSVNTLLLTTRSSWHQTSDPLVNYSVLAELLEGNVIVDTASEIVSNLTRISCILQKIDSMGSSAERLYSVLLAYTRNWLE